MNRRRWDMMTMGRYMKLILTVGLLAFAVNSAACGDDSSTTTPKKTGTTAKKGAGAASGTAAKSSGQKTGSKAAANKSTATNTGATSGDLGCDSSTEGVAFCADEDNLVFCADGAWWQLSCSSVVAGAFCGEDPDSLLVDCAVEGEDL